MHELSLASEVIEIVTANLADYPGAHVKAVRLSVGAHSGVDADAMRFCFPLAAEGTPVAGAALVIDEITAGRELDVESIDLELPDGPGTSETTSRRPCDDAAGPEDESAQ